MRSTCARPRAPIAAAAGSTLRPRRFASAGLTSTRCAPARSGKWLNSSPTSNSTATEQFIAEEVLKEIRGRLAFLCDVGLEYLTLARTAPTLSGGESQRIRLASQIGAGLVGVLYILDEPSIGLHARDNSRLLDSLCRLRDMGNTVIVVEHDEQTMQAADEIVDFGPGPGYRGGKVVAHGTIDKIKASKHSITGKYLRGEEEIAIPEQRRPIKPR